MGNKAFEQLAVGQRRSLVLKHRPAKALHYEVGDRGCHRALPFGEWQRLSEVISDELGISYGNPKNPVAYFDWHSFSAIDCCTVSYKSGTSSASFPNARNATTAIGKVR